MIKKWVIIMAMVSTLVSCSKERVVINEDFSSGFGNWWVEGGEDVLVKNGGLHMSADGDVRSNQMCTVWCRTPVKGNVKIEYVATVEGSEENYNNINFFFMYSDPSGQELVDTVAQRMDGDYHRYHELNGYIITYLNNPKDGAEMDNPDGTRKARMRMRRCPGFNLVTETFDYNSQQGVEYHFMITVVDGKIDFYVDGKKYLSWTDPQPLHGGLIGLRTYRSQICWDNVKVTELD